MIIFSNASKYSSIDFVQTQKIYNIRIEPTLLEI